jgi:ribosomal protein L6P/L9E
MGYKNAIIGSKLILRLAPSHRLVYNIQDNLKLTYINKQYLVLKSKSLSLVKKVVFFLQKFGKINAYKKIGIFLKGNIIFVKTSSKKSKF